MLAEQRRQKIIDLIRENGAARVSYLSETFGVTEPTIRQDLMKLEEDGEIVREHGGAFLKDFSKGVRELSLHHRENMDKKIPIGRKAAEFVKNGDTIILDSGSTVTELAKSLSARENLKIITNSLNITLLLGAEPDHEVHLTGGEFKAPTLSLTGEKAAEFLAGSFVDKLFLATAGISFKVGLMYPGFSDIPVKRAMIDSAREVYLLADSTKIGKTSFAVLSALDCIDYLITDPGIGVEDRRRFEELGIRVVLCD
ncbi:DeoR/GlpR family DNA-binding transcription regulator [Marispirochaeta sp.]|jgi:DeoR/GlpR family transcriptional regulator of sugar metabolism|uniref:DeoR/GlpR family DNA-binding transcription regulator n=1 Tax=Marispirochaeta sp. TaxID=2038653 RepID=UPI0029C81A14|nr:DeoR/GlpR family DNA-binding transcription regulator [Marispirochaeta sp.]